MRDKKALEPQHVAVVGTADDDRSADAGLEQADAAQDQRPHDPLAEIRFRDQQRPEPVRRDEQGLHRPSRIGVHQGRPARQLRQFAHERARVVGDDQLAAAGFVVPCDVDVAGQDDDQAVAGFADLDQRVTRAIGADHAKATHPLDFRWIE